MEPVIQEGGKNDLAWVDDVHDRFYVQTGLYTRVFNDYVRKSTRAFARAWDPKQDRIWTTRAGDGGDIVGGVAVCHREDGWMQLRYLFVDEGARGHGLGARLVDLVIDHARSQGAPGVMLWTMEGLEPARRLYESRGFRLAATAPAPWHHVLVQQRFDLRF